MSPWLRALAADFGLDQCPPFYREGPFYAAVGAGVGFWVSLALWGRISPMEPADLLAPAFLALAGWQPCCEELLFRGYLQGLLRRQSWGRLCRAGVTRANVLVSLLFALGHAWAHPPLWAVAVFFPSLVFGSLRDRYESVYPAVALHILYNAGYFALTGGR